MCKIVTTKTFIEKAIEIHGDRYNYSQVEYVKSNEKVIIICKKHKEFLQSPHDHIIGRGCPHCKNNYSIKSEEKFYQQLKDREFIMIGEYINTEIPVNIICKNGHVSCKSPNSFMGGAGCAKCVGTCPKQAEENFRIEAEKRNIKILGPYINNRIRIECQCEKGHIFYTASKPFIMGSGCPKCAGTCPEQAKENTYLEAQKRNIDILSPYVKANIKMSFKCHCGNTFKMTPSHFKGGHGCSNCSKAGFKFYEPAYFYVFKLEKDKNEGIGYGITNNTKIRFRQHRFTFRETNTNATLLSVFHFESGLDAQKIECVLKQQIENINFGIDGFKSECLSIEYKDWLIEEVGKTGKLVDIKF